MATSPLDVEGISSGISGVEGITQIVAGLIEEPPGPKHRHGRSDGNHGFQPG